MVGEVVGDGLAQFGDASKAASTNTSARYLSKEALDLV